MIPRASCALRHAPFSATLDRQTVTFYVPANFACSWRVFVGAGGRNEVKEGTRALTLFNFTAGHQGTDRGDVMADVSDGRVGAHAGPGRLPDLTPKWNLICLVCM